MKRSRKGLIGAITIGVIILVALILLVLSVKFIPVGYVGVVYSANHGVEEETLTDWFNIIAPTKKVKTFTIGNEQLILTKDKREGSKENESFNVSTSDNASINISFQMSYRFNPDTVVDTYKKYKGMDGEDIIDKRVRSVLKSRISEITTEYSMMDIYSGNRSEINNNITKYLNKQFAEQFGIEIMDASIIDVHPDEQLEQTIKDRVTALQKKQQAEAEQETIKVQAETALIEADNKAAIKIKEAQAEAESNRIKSSSITPELLQMKEMEARLKHGWITVQGIDSVIADDK